MCVCVEVMDDVLIWSHVVLVLAVIPWLSYVIVLLFYALSILYGSVSLSVRLSVCRPVCQCRRLDRTWSARPDCGACWKVTDSGALMEAVTSRVSS